MDTTIILQVAVSVIAAVISFIDLKDLIRKINAERQFSKKVAQIKMSNEINTENAQTEIFRRQVELIKLLNEVKSEPYTTSSNVVAWKLSANSEYRLRKIIDLVELAESDKSKIREGLLQPSERSRANYARKLIEEISKATTNPSGA